MPCFMKTMQDRLTFLCLEKSLDPIQFTGKLNYNCKHVME